MSSFRTCTFKDFDDASSRFAHYLTSSGLIPPRPDENLAEAMSVAMLAPSSFEYAVTKIALLNFSSGTTGRPKAVAIPHYAVIANTIQMAVYAHVNVDYAPKEEKRYRPGQVAIAGASSYVNAEFVLN